MNFREVTQWSEEPHPRTLNAYRITATIPLWMFETKEICKDGHKMIKYSIELPELVDQMEVYGFDKLTSEDDPILLNCAEDRVEFEVYGHQNSILKSKSAYLWVAFINYSLVRRKLLESKLNGILG